MRIDFTPSQRTSLGVEWELELVDLDTRQLTVGVERDPDARSRPTATASIPRPSTSCCSPASRSSPASARRWPRRRLDLAETVAEVASARPSATPGVMCTGTHPITDWATQQVTDNERYLSLMERNQWMARQLQIFGVHVHCGIRAPREGDPDRQRAAGVPAALPGAVGVLAVLDRLGHRARVLPQQGVRGAADRRPALPALGLGRVRAVHGRADLVAHSSRSIREVWWDIRPHPGFGTVELRICDGLPTLDEIGCVAALAQCLVERFDRQLDNGYTLPQPLPWLVRENKWRAARYGLDAEIVIDNTGNVRPVKEAINDLVEDLLPIARRLDCADGAGDDPAAHASAARATSASARSRPRTTGT